MLPIKSKYKIAKRLGAGIFEQTQTQKFALAESRRRQPRRRGPSDFGLQLLEKQRVRFTYGLYEKQLWNYAKEAMTEKDPAAALHKALELRADSVIYRAGFAPTRRAARQAISHGHFMVNGQRTTIPSRKLKVGDVVEVRQGNKTSPLYAGLADKEEHRGVPKWLDADVSLVRATVTGEPPYVREEIGLDYPTVFEFYSR